MRLLINPSANLFVFGDFNVHQKDWLTYSGVTMDLVNPVTIFLSQMALLRWLTSLLKSLTMTHSPALLDLFISTNAGTSSTTSFPLGISDHEVVCLYWLSAKLKMRCPVSSHSLWLFSCWLGWSSFSLDKCSMRRYL